MKKKSNLINSGNADIDMRDLFEIGFTTYRLSENYNLIYKSDPTCAIPKRLIELYIKYINPDYNSMIYSFKNKYISNEVLVEKNDSKEQRQGLRLLYDYIQGYNFGDKPLDIFVASLKLNSLLWQPTDEKNSKDIIRQREDYMNRITQLKMEAKKEKNLAKMKEVSRLERELRNIGHKSKLGGMLRSNNYEDEVALKNLDIKIPAAREAMDFMNSYINPDKKKEFEDVLKNADIIDYISYCVRETTKLIFYQPFMDGNKRTFRGLLNLMFKQRGLPPVYIKSNEREVYKNALYKGIKEEKYDEIIGFYLFKICDSIYELDVLPYKQARLVDLKGNVGGEKKNGRR